MTIFLSIFFSCEDKTVTHGHGHLKKSNQNTCTPNQNPKEHVVMPEMSKPLQTKVRQIKKLLNLAQ